MCCCSFVDGGKPDPLAEQGIAHQNVCNRIRVQVPAEEDAAIAGVADAPAGLGLGYKREDQISLFFHGAGDWCTRRLDGVEGRRSVALETSDDGCRIRGPVAAEELVVGDDLVEGGTSGGGATEVGCVIEAKKDVLQDLVGDSPAAGKRAHLRCLDPR